MSIVRQLDPGLHIDGHIASVTELARFMPQACQDPNLPLTFSSRLNLEMNMERFMLATSPFYENIGATSYRC